MAGQVDIIISKQAMAEIETATAKLETLRLKVLEVNKAGAKTTGVSNNDNIVKEIQKTNQLIASQKNLISAKKKTTAAIKGTAQALANEINQLKKEQNTLTTSNKSWLQYEMRIMKVQSKLKSLTATQSQVSIATRKSSNANKGFSGSLGGIGKVLKGGGILFALMKLKDLAVALVKNVFSLAKQFDSLRFALERTSASLLEAKMNSAFMLKLSNDLGLSLIATTTRFIKFAAAARNSGLAMRDVQKIFGTMAKAGAVLGLRTDELSGVFLALEQMLSKGKVTTEELRRQLGERLPGAFGIMAASLGVTLPKLDEMLKKGELLSAEVLPGFADAVEQAFGLESVDKVETLVASQNRLTTAWQNFVKNITGEESTIKRVFKTVLDSITDVINVIDSYVNSSEFFNQEFMAFGFDTESDIIKRKAKEKLEATKKEGEKLEDLQLRAAKALTNKKNSLNNAAAEEELRLAVAAVLKYNKELGKIEQQEAEKRFNESFVEYQKQKEEVEALQLELNNLNATPSESMPIISKVGKGIATAVGGMAGGALAEKVLPKSDRENNILVIRKKLEKQTRNLNQAEGKLNADRLLAETSKSAILDPKSIGDTKKTLDKISDLKNKALVAQLLKEIEINKESINVAKSGSEEMIELIQSNVQKEITIEGLLAEDKIKLAKKVADKKIEQSKRVLGEGKELTQRLIDIEKERTDTVSIIEQNNQKKVIAITKSYFSILEKETKKHYNFKVLEVNGAAAKEITNLREVYLKDLETTEDKKALNKKYLLDKNKLEVASFNAIIDLRIEEEKVLAGLTKENNKYTQGLQARIDVLEGKKKVAKVPGEDGGSELDKEKEKFQTLLGYASDYADALGDIASGIFDGKIQEIDAEIEATRLKYDEMFLLAEGDAKQTKLLRIQEAEDLAKLEKKKRKLQRQKAIFDKANALIQIAINTAVAVSRVPADLGPAGLPLIPIIIGLGALQTAAVLAQPLPKFAKGGVMGHDGLAVVGDGGKQEVIRTPDGKLSLTPSTDTVVNLKKGTEIFSSVEKFNQQNPNEMSTMLHSASLLASISLNQKNINGMMSGKQQLDERLLDAMLLNTKAVKKSQSNTYVKTQNIDIAHELWKSNLLN